MMVPPELIPVVWERAAEMFEKAGCWLEASSCWRAAGLGDRAVRALKEGNDLCSAAVLLQESGSIEEALNLWEKILAVEEDDFENRLAARFGVASCLFLQNENQRQAKVVFREARTLLTEMESLRQRPLSAGRCWEWLGWFGKTVGRHDLIQVGYEQALRCYGETLKHEWLRAARVYLDAVSGNRLLADDLEKRIMRWESLGV